MEVFRNIYRCFVPESDVNDDTTLERGDTNPLDVTLKDIAEKSVSFLNENESLQNTKKEIEEKCEIKKDHGDCWSADDIKRVWGQTQSLNTAKPVAHVIILQMLIRFMFCDKCKPYAAHNNTTDETKQSCETRTGTKENSVDTSSRRKAGLETAGAAGGVVSEVSKLADDSGVAAGSQLSSASTDEDPSPAEVNPIADSINIKTKSAALNEDEDTSVNNCEQQNDELLADVHDKKNAGLNNQSACGISQRVKGNSEDRSTQRNAEPQQTEQTKDTAKQPPGAEFPSTKRKFSCRHNTGSDNTGDTESESLPSTCGKRDNSKPKRLSKGNDNTWERAGSKKSNNSQNAYLRLPFSVMSEDESPFSTDTDVPDDPCTYKLIDRVPKLTEIRKRKSYALLYNNQTRNAAWVYEILNRETLKQEIERENDPFKEDQSIHPFYRTSKDKYPDHYHRGHLAPARNHSWCQEAYEDTFLMSNISPQHGTLNRGRWKSLEDKCRSEALKPDIRNVHVYSGPLYLPKDDNSRVVYELIETQAVPTHFFKVIIKERIDGTAELKCYMMPNEELDPNEDYTVSIENIERASGLIFRESGCSEGETTSLRKLTWTGDNDDEKEFSVTTQVNISTPQIKRLQ